MREEVRVRIRFPVEMEEMGRPRWHTVGWWREMYGKVYGRGPYEVRLLLKAGWMHGFLWGMSEEDRAMMLRVETGEEWGVEEVEEARREMGLKGWEDFPGEYKEAPFWVEIEEGRL